MSNWQKSLRSSTGGAALPSRRDLPRPRAVRQTEAWPLAPQHAKPSIAGTRAAKNRKLSSVQEEDHENKGPNAARARRSRKSTLGSISSISSVPDVCVDEADEVFSGRKRKVGKAPSKKAFLPLTLEEPALLSPINHYEELVSPVPLPPGVHCIDPDDGTENSYAAASIQYMKMLENKLGNCTKWELQKYTKERHRRIRTLLIDWIIEVVHYFKCSQESLYQAIQIIDRFMAETAIASDQVQLVGVAAVLIATKLEEYYAANVSELRRLTMNSYTEDQILAMELHIMTSLKYQIYGVDPMIFINRLIRAAFREGDVMFYEACIFFLDCITTDEKYWAIKTDKKAAAAVLAALNLIPDVNTIVESSIWTPTLEYYSGFRHDQLALLTRQMLELISTAKERSKTDKDCGLVNKYRSNSRHNGFITSGLCSQESIDQAVDNLSSLN